MESGRTRTTNNLSLAAFAYMQGMEIAHGSASVIRGRTNYRFVFVDSEDRWEAMCIEFANSESARYDNAVRQLKVLTKHTE